MLRTLIEYFRRRQSEGEPQITIPLEDVVEIQRRIERAYKRACTLGLPLSHPVIMDLKLANLILKKTAGRPKIDQP